MIKLLNPLFIELSDDLSNNENRKSDKKEPIIYKRWRVWSSGDDTNLLFLGDIVKYKTPEGKSQFRINPEINYQNQQGRYIRQDGKVVFKPESQPERAYPDSLKLAIKHFKQRIEGNLNDIAKDDGELPF